MILFFGTRPGKARQLELGDLECPHCRQQHTLTASIRPNYIHVFWLAVFRISTWQQISCDHCKGVFFKDEFNAPMKNAVNSWRNRQAP